MTNENRGLSCEEAQKRLYAGYGNVQVKNQSKSVGQIIAGNIFTYFNFIFAVFTALLVFVRSYVNMTFAYYCVQYNDWHCSGNPGKTGVRQADTDE